MTGYIINNGYTDPEKGGLSAQAVQNIDNFMQQFRFEQSTEAAFENAYRVHLQQQQQQQHMVLQQQQQQVGGDSGRWGLDGRDYYPPVSGVPVRPQFNSSRTDHSATSQIRMNVISLYLM